MSSQYKTACRNAPLPDLAAFSMNLLAIEARLPHNIRMVLFLTAFLFLYSLLNFYLFVRVRTALALGPVTTVPLVLFLLVMITAPILVRLSENAGLAAVARVVAFAGYTWLGLLFLFVCTAVAIDVFRFALFLAGRASGHDLAFLTTYGKFYFFLSLAAVIAIGIYGGFEARTIRTERITVRTSKLYAGANPVRIVQISDVHLGLIVRQDRLREIMERVRKAKPDLLVSTGDLVDGQMNHLDGVAVLIDNLKPRYGKFAVTGNHEFYAGLDQALAFTRQAGFRVLQGEVVTIPGVMNIVGRDDPAGPGIGSSATGESSLLRSAANGQFVLFLKHRPEVDKGSLGLFDLQLSGHVHYGQIFPFRLLTRLAYPFVGGLYSLPAHSSLYVNRGTGTWGPPIRFLAPPEVTVIDLVPQSTLTAE
jgi:predicted MPP superfamily phosphohydrolase